ncbi:MAG: hypothetical protein HYZ34_07955, partial [Ignavibacteriae bacterium]|nr:hypothetical protein [Ignavibacteriota bacterium]
MEDKVEEFIKPDNSKESVLMKLLFTPFWQVAFALVITLVLMAIAHYKFDKQEGFLLSVLSMGISI